MSESKTPRILNLPPRIWLNFGEVDEDVEFNDIRNLWEVTWCDCAQDDSDVAYALESDLSAALALAREHRSEFLGEIQRRVIELGGNPPDWPARNDIEANDDVESAARMILELLARAEKAEAEARRAITQLDDALTRLQTAHEERDALAARLAEVERDRYDLAHAIWRALDDSCEDMTKDEITIMRSDYDKLCSLVPEDHEELHAKFDPHVDIVDAAIAREEKS